MEIVLQLCAYSPQPRSEIMDMTIKELNIFTKHVKEKIEMEAKMMAGSIR